MSIVQKIFRDDVLALAAYHVPDASGLIKLDAMENPFDLPDALRQALAERLAHTAINRYPVPSYRTLKQKLARAFGVSDGYSLTLGNGSDELITMLAVACARPGATLMAPVPTFVMYAMSAKLAGMAFTGVPLRADFSLDMPAMLDAIRQQRPALLFVSNPNNPTGNWVDEADLVQLLHAMDGIGLVIVDEAYQPFAPGTMMGRLPEFDHLVVMRTVSKLGWAGLRLGYMAAAAAVLEQVEKVRPPYNINVLTEAAAEVLLDNMSVFDQQAQQLRDQRAVLIAALQHMSSVEVFASQANFVLIRVANAEQIFTKLLERKILIKNVGKMHALLQNCLRVTVGTAQQNQQFVDALATALKP